MKKYNVAVVGATGAVGQEMLHMLELRNFPVENLRLFASKRSLGRELKFQEKKIKVEELTHSAVKNLKSSVEIALFSAGGTISKEYAKEFSDQGIFVIDNSSAWRMDPEVPLAVPEINSDSLRADTHLIANPNCSTIQMVVVLAPLHRAAKITRIIVSTYQSVSGAGGKTMIELKRETEKILKKINVSDSLLKADCSDFLLSDPEDKSDKILPHQIAFNLIPHIDVFQENLYTKEEMKMVNETRKILADDTIKISATCVRVPVFRSHAESVWIETEKKLTVEETGKILETASGVEVIDDTENKKYPLPVDCAYKQKTYVGRIRQDLSVENGLVMWVVSDNLLKGAALNAVQIAEEIVKKKYL